MARRLKMADLDPDQVSRMRGTYGMSDADILAAAQQIEGPVSTSRSNYTPPRKKRNKKR